MLIQRQNPCLKLPWSYWKTLILKRSLLSLWAGQNQIYSSQMVTGLRRLKMMMMMMVTLSLVSRDLDHFFDNSDTERKSPKRNSRNYTWNEIIQWMMKVYSPCLKERSFWEEFFCVEYFFWHWIIHKSLHLTLWVIIIIIITVIRIIVIVGIVIIVVTIIIIKILIIVLIILSIFPFSSYFLSWPLS